MDNDCTNISPCANQEYPSSEVFDKSVDSAFGTTGKGYNTLAAPCTSVDSHQSSVFPYETPGKDSTISEEQPDKHVKTIRVMITPAHDVTQVPFIHSNKHVMNDSQHAVLVTGALRDKVERYIPALRRHKSITAIEVWRLRGENSNQFISRYNNFLLEAKVGNFCARKSYKCVQSGFVCFRCERSTKSTQKSVDPTKTRANSCRAYVSYDPRILFDQMFVIVRKRLQHNGHDLNSKEESKINRIDKSLRRYVAKLVKQHNNNNMVLVQAHQWAVARGYTDIQDRRYHLTKTDIAMIRSSVRKRKKPKLEDDDDSSEDELLTTIRPGEHTYAVGQGHTFAGAVEHKAVESHAGEDVGMMPLTMPVASNYAVSASDLPPPTSRNTYKVASSITAGADISSTAPGPAAALLDRLASVAATAMHNDCSVVPLHSSSHQTIQASTNPVQHPPNHSTHNSALHMYSKLKEALQGHLPMDAAAAKPVHPPAKGTKSLRNAEKRAGIGISPKDSDKGTHTDKPLVSSHYSDNESHHNSTTVTVASDKYSTTNAADVKAKTDDNAYRSKLTHVAQALAERSISNNIRSCIDSLYAAVFDSNDSST